MEDDQLGWILQSFSPGRLIRQISPGCKSGLFSTHLDISSGFSLTSLLSLRVWICGYAHRHGTGCSHSPQWANRLAQNVSCLTADCFCMLPLDVSTSELVLAYAKCLFEDLIKSLTAYINVSKCRPISGLLLNCQLNYAWLNFLNSPFVYRGGVYTPGAAFAKTTLIDRLNKHGIQFSVI